MTGTKLLIVGCLCLFGFSCWAQEAKQDAPKGVNIPSSSLDQPAGKTLAGKAPTKSPRFLVTLSSPSKSFKTDQPIDVVVTIKNLSDQEVPWSPGFDDVRITVKHGSVEAARTLYHRTLRGETMPSEPTSLTSGSKLTLLIPINQTASQTLDLKKLYELEPGTYSVVAQRYDEVSDVFVRSNWLTFTVVK